MDKDSNRPLSANKHTLIKMNDSKGKMVGGRPFQVQQVLISCPISFNNKQPVGKPGKPSIKSLFACAFSPDRRQELAYFEKLTECQEKQLALEETACMLHDRQVCPGGFGLPFFRLG